MSGGDATPADPVSVHDLVVHAAARLGAVGVLSPEVDARLLARATLGVDVREDAPVRPSIDARDAFERAVTRRCAREPLQLIVGGTGFHAIDVACRPGVFVPRPETEVLVELALTLLADRHRSTDPSGPSRVAEPCTGSGAVALAIAAARSDVHIVASDRSIEAVALAQENLVTLGRAGSIAGTVEVRHGDLLDPLSPDWRGTLDLLVANPPYLPAADLASLAPEVSAHDPHDALIGGPDGHEVVDALLLAAATWLAPGGHVLLEIDDRRGRDAIASARAAGLDEVAVHPDLTGRDRVLVARRALGTGPSRE